MDKKEVYEKLNEAFREVFDDDDLVVDANTTADDIEDWDSLEHVNLVNAVEEKTGIKFNNGEIGNFKNVGDMADKIISKQ